MDNSRMNLCSYRCERCFYHYQNEAWWFLSNCASGSGVVLRQGNHAIIHAGVQLHTLATGTADSSELLCASADMQ
jgi:hypothetical protein